MSFLIYPTVKQAPILGMLGMGGGIARAGSSGPNNKISTYNELLSSQDSKIEGEVTHNGYGFMLYTGYKGAFSGTSYNTIMNTSNIDKIRFVLMGGGGGANTSNITSAGASGGIEGWIDTSSMDTLKLNIGSGAPARCSGDGYSGGNSEILRDQGGGSYTSIASSLGGLGVDVSGYNNTRRGTSYNSTYVTAISRARGGIGGASTSKSNREPSVELSPTLSGAYAHGASAGKHAEDLSNDISLGYGGGGGGYYDGNPGKESPGGPLGYKGGMGSSSGGTAAEGPSTINGRTWGSNSGQSCSGYTHPLGGGGGGCFGAAGIEIYDIAEGASGLVKIWWASNTGDTSVLTTVGNLYA